jgi:hypothetical protein
VRDTPLSEAAFVGAGIGAAMGGMRPIVEIMTVNFSLLALDQIVTTRPRTSHVGRPAERPRRDPHGHGRGPAARRAALAQPRELVRAHPRHPGPVARHAGGRARDAVARAGGSRSGDHLRARGAVQPAGRDRRGRGARGHQPRGGAAAGEGHFPHHLRREPAQGAGGRTGA